MAKRKKPKSKKQTRQTPGWIWMLFGLSLGLVVATAIYVGDRRAPTPVSAATEQATAPAPLEAVVETSPEPEPDSGESGSETRFDFYDMLPQFEVVIPEVETNATPATRTTAVEEPGSYELQAGSFRELADADRMRASLALLGIESRLQRVAIDEDIFHRVRVGPTNDLTHLNQMRRRLDDADITYLMFRLSD